MFDEELVSILLKLNTTVMLRDKTTQSFTSCFRNDIRE